MIMQCKHCGATVRDLRGLWYSSDSSPRCTWNEPTHHAPDASALLRAAVRQAKALDLTHGDAERIVDAVFEEP